jgi:glycerophosphoryl diester phosphodiesterase
LLGLASVLALGPACGQRAQVEHPTFPNGGLLADAAPLPSDRLVDLEGIYEVSAGNDHFGSSVVVHSARDTLSIFAAKNAAYSVMRAGCLDGGDRLVLEGYYRYGVSTDTGLVRLFVEPPELAHALCAGEPAPAVPAALSGKSGSGGALPDTGMGLTWQRELIPTAGRFQVVAHRGGCRTIDDCGASENSLEVLRMAESFGATAVEIDVQLTKDGVPILYHDDTFNERLSQGVYCHGPVADFTFAHVRALCTLEYGEQVPTLEQALEVILNETELSGVWLDLKTPDAMAATLKAAAKYRALASQQGRDLEIAMGIGTREILDAYLAADRPEGPHCVVELEPDDVRAADCHVWAPRWTQGPMADEVKSLQKEGHAVVYWTLDEPEFVDLFLTEGHPNGVLSNRPGLILHRFQSLGGPAP